MYGGVAGSIVGDDNSMSNCCNSGEIKETGYSVGGLCGFFSGNMVSSYNYGNISGKHSVGGISGYLGGNCKNCYNYGNIEVATNKFYIYSVGGVVGRKVGNVNLTLNNVFNYGYVTIGSGIGGDIFSEETEVTSCYYRKNTATKGIYNREDESGVVEAIEESEMPSVIEVVQNQIEVNRETINAWKEDTNNINNGYPLLYWQ